MGAMLDKDWSPFLKGPRFPQLRHRAIQHLDTRSSYVPLGTSSRLGLVSLTTRASMSGYIVQERRRRTSLVFGSLKLNCDATGDSFRCITCSLASIPGSGAVFAVRMTFIVHRTSIAERQSEWNILADFWNSIVSFVEARARADVRVHRLVLTGKWSREEIYDQPRVMVVEEKRRLLCRHMLVTL
ncbi:hypothetical protein PENSPDRAFT_253301 [Peniophora sp. CONT]|nr:hypothetical protein PENSPDRAFT_253301 [Peniophora sp. CONT]